MFVMVWETILPGQALDIEEGRVYKEELVRIKRFFLKQLFRKGNLIKEMSKFFRKKNLMLREVKTLPPKNNDGGIV